MKQTSKRRKFAEKLKELAQVARDILSIAKLLRLTIRVVKTLIQATPWFFAVLMPNTAEAIINCWI